MKIEDNLLEQDEFDHLQTFMMGENFSWFYKNAIVFPEEREKKQSNNFQFIHLFYDDRVPISPFYEKLTPIFNKIQALSFLRIKANLRTRTSKIVPSEFHIDMQLVISEEKLKQWWTSIFYLNTNNGYTEFEDGTKVESVANRIVSFSSDGMEWKMMYVEYF